MTDDGTTTHAVRIHRYGGPEEMRYERVEVPPPGDGEVQIRHRTVGVNYLDTYHCRGVFPLPQLPGALGVEGAGEVVAVGAGVKAFAAGDRVTYIGRPIGSYAGVRNIAADYVLPLPDNVTFEQAGAATLQGLTAHMLLRRVAPLGNRDTVLVHAAAGGLGSLLCQWARLEGARVIGTVGSEEKARLALDRGCDDIILYREEPFVDGVRRLTDGEGVDAVYEGLGGEVFHQSLTCLKAFGHLINLGQVAEGLPTVNLADLGPANPRTVSVPGVFAYVACRQRLEAAGRELFDLISRGMLRVHVGGSYPLQEAAAAHQALKGRETSGSLILWPEHEG